LILADVNVGPGRKPTRDPELRYTERDGRDQLRPASAMPRSGTEGRACFVDIKVFGRMRDGSEFSPRLGRDRGSPRSKWEKDGQTRSKLESSRTTSSSSVRAGMRERLRGADADPPARRRPGPRGAVLGLTINLSHRVAPGRPSDDKRRNAAQPVEKA
jgi:hypothetical protein